MKNLTTLFFVTILSVTSFGVFAKGNPTTVASGNAHALFEYKMADFTADGKHHLQDLKIVQSYGFPLHITIHGINQELGEARVETMKDFLQTKLGILDATVMFQKKPFPHHGKKLSFHFMDMVEVAVITTD